MSNDPFHVLGLGGDASPDDVRAARRRLARALHPDAGGEGNEMQRINVAAEDALRQLARRPGEHSQAAIRAPEPQPPEPQPFESETGGVRVDSPSFVVEALPAETFQAVLAVSGALGRVVDEDPPYRLDVVLGPPLAGWCRLEIVPDAGASTVSLAMSGAPRTGVTLEQLRDRWIDMLNELDWESAVG